MNRPAKLSILMSFWFLEGIIILIVSIWGFVSIYNFSLGFGLLERYKSHFAFQASLMFFLFLFASSQLWISYQIWKGQNYSRVLKVLSILHLLSIPFGTALGIATLIIMNSQEVKYFLQANKKV